MARAKALLRRARLSRDLVAHETQATEAERLVFGNLVIEASRREVLRQGVPLPLRPKEFDLLLFLARHHRRVLSRDVILEQVWGWIYGGGSRTVDVHVRWLCIKIEPDPRSAWNFPHTEGSFFKAWANSHSGADAPVVTWATVPISNLPLKEPARILWELVFGLAGAIVGDFSSPGPHSHEHVAIDHHAPV